MELAIERWTMVLSILKVTGSPERRNSIIDVLRVTERRTRPKPGCVDCGVFEAQGEDGNVILYLEKWRSREDLCRHIQSDGYLLLLNSMEFASREPEIHFLEVPDTNGLEIIRALRIGGIGDEPENRP